MAVRLLVAAMALLAAGCDALDTSVSGSSKIGDAPVVDPAEHEDAFGDTPEGVRSAPTGEPRTVAIGEAQGVAWKLFTLPSTGGDFLCFEAPSAAAFACATSFERSVESGDEAPEVTLPKDWAVLGFPTLAKGTPSFVFGTIETTVALVTIELESADPIEAGIVGEDRAHYVAVLPPEASPREVVASSADGEELARRELVGDGPVKDSWVDSFEQTCEKTGDGGYHCEGSAHVGGYSGGPGGVEDEGEDDR